MGFVDRFQHYHEELSDQVLKELIQIKFEAQMKKNVSKKQKSHTVLNKQFGSVLMSQKSLGKTGEHSVRSL
jgi:hypothetical protein